MKFLRYSVAWIVAIVILIFCAYPGIMALKNAMNQRTQKIDHFIQDMKGKP